MAWSFSGDCAGFGAQQGSSEWRGILLPAVACRRITQAQRIASPGLAMADPANAPIRRWSEIGQLFVARQRNFAGVTGADNGDHVDNRPFEQWRTLREEVARLVSRCRRNERLSSVGRGRCRPGHLEAEVCLPADTLVEIDGLLGYRGDPGDDGAALATVVSAAAGFNHSVIRCGSVDPRVVNARLLAPNIVPRATLPRLDTN